MAETITITIPDAPKERDELLRFLKDKGLVATNAPGKGGKYAELARQYRQEKVLTGYGEEVSKLRKEFREDFRLSP